MNTIKIILIAVLVLGPLSTIMLIGKERKPITPGNAALSVVTSALAIIGILYL